MTTTINASPSNGLVSTADGSGILKVQSNGVTTNALAWVNFNGTTSPGTIRSAYNVGSVTKNATGDYTLNFSNTLSDANYAVLCSAGREVSTSDATWKTGQKSFTTTSVRVLTTYGIDATLYDATYASVAVFGN